MTYLSKTSALAIAAACVAAPFTAQAADDSIVVTASRATQDAREIGSSVSVISAEDIQQNQIIFVKDALQDLPGVKITTDRPGDYAGVSIRGSNNDEVLWLIDGIELGDPSATSTEFRADHLTSRDISRIEVLRGNQSSLYGSDAIGGVVHYITASGRENSGTSFVAEGGSFGTVRLGGRVAGVSDALDYAITGSFT